MFHERMFVNKSKYFCFILIRLNIEFVLSDNSNSRINAFYYFWIYDEMFRIAKYTNIINKNWKRLLEFII